MGKVYFESDYHNDNGVGISCAIGTFEWDIDDVRVMKKWFESMLDCVPASGLTVTPISGGVAVAYSASIAASSLRSQPPALVPVSASILRNYLCRRENIADCMGHGRGGSASLDHEMVFSSDFPRD